jgi:hypothetical protein
VPHAGGSRQRVSSRPPRAITVARNPPALNITTADPVGQCLRRGTPAARRVRNAGDLLREIVQLPEALTNRAFPVPSCLFGSSAFLSAKCVPRPRGSAELTARRRTHPVTGSAIAEPSSVSPPSRLVFPERMVKNLPGPCPQRGEHTVSVERSPTARGAIDGRHERDERSLSKKCSPRLPGGVGSDGRRAAVGFGQRCPRMNRSVLLHSGLASGRSRRTRVRLRCAGSRRSRRPAREEFPRQQGRCEFSRYVSHPDSRLSSRQRNSSASRLRAGSRSVRSPTRVRAHQVSATHVGVSSFRSRQMCWFRRSGNVPLGERFLDVLADARARLIRHSCADGSLMPPGRWAPRGGPGGSARKARLPAGGAW